MVVSAAVPVAMFVTLQAFTLSGEQVVDRDLGRFAFHAGLDVAAQSPGQPSVAPALVERARQAGAREAEVVLTSFDVRPDPARASQRPPLALYLETDWTARPFPERYSLIRGRWPAQPGEAVLTQPLDAVTNSESLSVFSGNERLRIVGTARDRFEAAPRILAATGTWDSFGTVTRDNFPTATATPGLYWTGGDPQRVIAAVSDVLAGNQAGLAPADAVAQITANLRSTATELSRDRRPWTQRLPIAYQIPSLALPLLSVLTIFGLNSRRLRRSLHVLQSVGMRRSHATAGLAVATSTWTMAATLIGVLAGIGLGAVARPICDRFLDGPISPLPDLTSPVLRVVALSAASCVLAAAILHCAGGRSDTRPTRPATHQRPRGRRAGRPTSSDVRQVIAVAAAVAALIQISTLDTVPEAGILAGTAGIAVLLFTPELVTATLRLLPTTNPRTRLGRTQLANDKDRAVAAVAVLATALGAPLGLLTLLATLISTAEDDNVPDVAPNQIIVATPGGKLHAPPPEIVKAVTDRVSFTDPAIQVSYLRTDQTTVSVQGEEIGSVLVVNTVEDANRLNNRPLPDTQARTLRNGGMLVWRDTGRDRRALIVKDRATDRVLTTTEPILAAPADFQPAWTSPADALLLTATARRLNLPVTPGALVYTNVSDSQAAAAEQATIDAGLDPSHVDIYQPPDPVTVPPVYYTAVVGLGVIVLATTMAVARTQVITLRSYLGRLIAVGLSPRWVRHVLFLQTAVVIGLSTVLALLLAVPPVILAAFTLPDFTLTIPWAWLALTIATFYAATLIATAASSRRLRSTDRLTT